MLHTNSPHQKRKRGRPRKPRRRKFADTVREYCERTGDSRSTAFRKMKEGVLRFIQEAPGYPRKIPHSEYLRLGYGEPADEIAASGSSNIAG
jgi:hypothetical protein